MTLVRDPIYSLCHPHAEWFIRSMNICGPVSNITHSFTSGPGTTFIGSICTGINDQVSVFPARFSSVLDIIPLLMI